MWPSSGLVNDRHGDGGWLFWGWWLTSLRMSGDHSKDGGWLSWGWGLTVLVMVGVYPGDVGHHPGQTWNKHKICAKLHKLCKVTQSQTYFSKIFHSYLDLINKVSKITWNNRAYFYHVVYWEFKQIILRFMIILCRESQYFGDTSAPACFHVWLKLFCS